MQAPAATPSLAREDLLVGEWRCLLDCPAGRVLAFASAAGVRRFDARTGEHPETTDGRWTLDGSRLTVSRGDESVFDARVVRLTTGVLELEIDGAREVPIYKRVARKD